MMKIPQYNTWIKAGQYKRLGFVIVSIVLFWLVLATVSRNPKQTTPVTLEADKVFIDASLNESVTTGALNAQHSELARLKSELHAIQKRLKQESQARVQDQGVLRKALQEEVRAFAASNAGMEQHIQDNSRLTQVLLPIRPVHAVTFHRRGAEKHIAPRLSPDNYVPSGTFVQAVVLGGADADASVDGQSKNNGVMLFKLLKPGTLPNGQHSHLEGCFVTASSYGDISSERAYVVLDKLSCAQKGRPMLDKSVTGWAFFGGKVGIKGRPLMRDNKVMQWAGISGAMAGIAQAAQYSQSVQSISPLGSENTVPSGRIAPYSAYGGASKAADVLSNYYIKRAEQYHPVIQVGSGNRVTIVFKDGFYLVQDESAFLEAQKAKLSQLRDSTPHGMEEENEDFRVPDAVLNQIQKPSVFPGEAS
jgi:conjugal transfer pilus assembly protein TraB